MDKKLYDLMDWPEIEGIVYSECKHPGQLLGQHVKETGLLIQAFLPDAVKVSVIIEGKDKEYNMEMADEQGYYAVLLPGKKKVNYKLHACYEDGSENILDDPYDFPSVIDRKELKAFEAGVNYSVYRILGAHKTVIKGVEGVNFAVWAPNALRVSVVGDFNMWDGRRHQMNIHDESGVFELFIPGVKELDLYKYEIRYKGGLLGMKSDPYGFYSQVRPDTASIVYDIDSYKWNDDKWLASRHKDCDKEEPVSILELHPGSFRKPQDGREFYTYRELAPFVIDYVKDMHYTHVELMPVMEHPLDRSWGYQVTGYYAPTSRYGTPEDFKYFIDSLHKAGIGVILDWVPAHFPKDASGLARFDGTCLYEHLDPRQGEHQEWGTLIYNYGRPQVRNFLIANAMFWAEEYHADGIRMDAVAAMLYLDYGKKDGEWVANIYGGNENLDAVEFFKQINTVMRKKHPGVMMIAEESTAWPRVTGDPKKDSLGFDYKWNMGWMNDFLDFMGKDPLFRKGSYGELTFSMIYAYSEDFILVLSHDEVVHGKGSMFGKMPGNTDELKFANLRAAYGYMFTHPGKKLLFMGQDFAQYNEWWEEKELDWYLLDNEANLQMQSYVRDLNKLYRKEAALYDQDYNPDGFQWINNISADECIVVFTRTSKAGDTLLVICNFTPVVRKDYKIGVPFAGKYKEIFNSDKDIYGGNNNINRRVKTSKAEECDGRTDSMRITVPPLGMSVFRYNRETKK